MLLRVFCNAREIANPTIPERVRKENIDPSPVTMTSHPTTKTTHRKLRPSRTFLISSADAPALLAPLEISLMSNSETSQDPAITAITSAMQIAVPVSTTGPHQPQSQAAHIPFSLTRFP